ncbi:MAG: hypothetical protein LBS39_00940 [Campylobacteraceae bacterium]|nr:hypothetical protein [Campylobacteraceae bacterium]
MPLVEIIECVTPDPNLLMWKFQDNGCEIQNGAKLTVYESRSAILISVNENGKH